MDTADRRALMAGDAEVCGEVRPDTLGYQRCVKTAAHDVHRSQDGKSWVSPQITDSRALARMTDEQLQAAEARAAADFTGYTLHSKRPVDKQGDTSPRAWALRAEVIANAERRWLEIQAEWDRR